MDIKRVAVIGMGAIGSVYGKYLFEEYKNDFVVIAGGLRAKRLEERGCNVNGQVFYPRVMIPEEKGWKTDLLLVCVKNEQLGDAINDIKNCVGANTVILSLLMGVSAADKIQLAYPDNVVLSGISVGLSTSRDENNGVTNSSIGSLKIGAQHPEVVAAQIDSVYNCLTKAGLVSEVLDDVNNQMWKKWLANVGINQVASALDLKYGQINKVPYAVKLMKLAMSEAIQVINEINNCGNLNLNASFKDTDIDEALATINSFPMFGKPSILQDLDGKRKTEVDSFSGILINLADKLSTNVPVNKSLYYIIKAKEQMYHIDKIV